MTSTIEINGRRYKVKGPVDATSSKIRKSMKSVSVFKLAGNQGKLLIGEHYSAAVFDDDAPIDESVSDLFREDAGE